MTKPWDPEGCTAAWNFAARAHGRQTMASGEIPYLTHVGNVAMEVMSALGREEEPAACPDLAVQCAILHDVLEDTDTAFATLAEGFGADVAEGVRALSKDEALASKDEQMADSLARIRLQPREVWMVKLADRISNMQPAPAHWDAARRVRYRAEAETILETLGEASIVLSRRLRARIDGYAVDPPP